uniref:Uncharacterized protein n=1 Tax=Pleurozia purpurea TaxID=280637 RepID=D0R019_9MARC|nr:hypothetical protein PlpuMp20 [Pleurozia purpurea]ACR19356.1 hypothetical protein PlpuMp20 [Pleurozia purpurea]
MTDTVRTYGLYAVSPRGGTSNTKLRPPDNSIALIPAYKLLKDYMNYLYLTKLLLTFQTELIYQLQNHGNLLRLTARKGLYCKVSGTNLHITTYGKLKSKRGRGQLRDCGLRYAPGWENSKKPLPDSRRVAESNPKNLELPNHQMLRAALGYTISTRCTRSYTGSYRTRRPRLRLTHLQSWFPSEPPVLALH